MMSRNNTKRMAIVCEGWLTKSPPVKRVWRGKWRKRWFTLRLSHDLHYFLDYYTDRNTRKLKGTIDLNFCDQVDAGLQMPGNDSKELRGSVFSIRTHSRVYHLEADSVTEMEKWVKHICQACNLQDNASETPKRHDREMENNVLHHQVPAPSKSSTHYIYISECFSGYPASNFENLLKQNELAKSAVVSEPVATGSTSAQFIASSPKRFIRASTSPVYVNNESLLQERKSFISATASKFSSPLGAVSRRFGRLSIGENSVNPSSPIPPRPPKPLHYSLDSHKETFKGPRIQEPTEEPIPSPSIYGMTPERYLPAQAVLKNLLFQHQRENGNQGHSSYYNINIPPAIHRELKPGRSYLQFSQNAASEIPAPHTLEYIDLDLDTPSSGSSFSKSQSHSPTNYKKVDFRKTNALNKTRLDTEASRKYENCRRE